MRLNFCKCGFLAGAASLLAIHAASGAVSLNFTDNDSTPTSANVNPGATFPFSVKLTETLPTDHVSGVDYQIHASTNGVFEFLSRNSQTAGSSFTSPNGFSDAALTPVILNPNNGTDLGTSTSSGQAVSGPGTYELSDFSFEVLPGTPSGVYTLSFVKAGYSGPPPGFAAGTFDTLGTFIVTVPVPVTAPEPASIALVGGLGAGLVLYRRRR